MLTSEPMVWDEEQQKVVPISQRKAWVYSRGRSKNTINIIQDSMDATEMVGLPPRRTPDGRLQDVVVDSKTQRKRLLKEHNMIELGNETPEMVVRKREEMAEKNGRNR